jgi:hypothetical protein
MRALSASELLESWENGFGQSPTRRAIILLQVACRDTTPDELARLSIGQRDGRLLALRESTFGPRLASLASCPACGERLELEFSTSDLYSACDSVPAGDLTLVLDRYEIMFRLPTSLDLIAISEQQEKNSARAALLSRCVSSALLEGREVDPGGLPQGVIDALGVRMAEVDPQADLHLALECPACNSQWQSRFDIESFFWTEINAWATRMLNEVHILASAYGWSESDILRMSARRRQSYLNLVSA